MPEHVGPQSPTTTGDSSRISVGTAIAFAGLAAVAAVVATIIFKPMAGDEPSIRVRGGSVDLVLESPGAEWEPISGSGDKWRMKNQKDRNKDDFYFVIDQTDGCSGPLKGKAKHVELILSNSTTIDVKVNANKTEVKGPDLSASGDTLSTKDKTLSLSKMKVGTGGGATECNYAAGLKVPFIGLHDYQDPE